MFIQELIEASITIIGGIATKIPIHARMLGAVDKPPTIQLRNPGTDYL
jgi:hypothetical protein